MKSKTLLIIVATTLILSGFTSCVSLSQNQRVKAYSDKRQNTQSLAIIKPSLEFNTHRAIPDNITEYTSIIQIDDQSVRRNSFKYPKRCDVLPGTHTITITHTQNIDDCHCQRFLGRYSVTFDAEAGKTYIIHSETDFETDVVDIYVTDEDSGERIASTVDYCYNLKEDHNDN